MTLKDLIVNAHLEATGKKRSLEPGSSKYEKLNSIANIMQYQWETEPDVVWKSRKSQVDIGPVKLNETKYRLTTDTYSLDEDETVKLVDANGEVQHEFYIRLSSQLGMARTVALEGWLLNFGNNLKDEMIDLNIVVPAILKLKPLVAPTDTIEIDDPHWLLYMTAAEYARNDRNRQHQRDNLLDMASNSLSGMKYRNEVGSGDMEIIRGSFF